MRRAFWMALLVAGCSAEPEAMGAPDPIVSTTLPEETAGFPPGPAGELVAARCTACHSAEMILQQPPMDAAKWAGIVKKMREVYRAPVPAGEDTALAAALASLRPAPGAGDLPPAN